MTATSPQTNSEIIMDSPEIAEVAPGNYAITYSGAGRRHILSAPWLEGAAQLVSIIGYDTKNRAGFMARPTAETDLVNGLEQVVGEYARLTTKTRKELTIVVIALGEIAHRNQSDKNSIIATNLAPIVDGIMRTIRPESVTIKFGSNQTKEIIPKSAAVTEKKFGVVLDTNTCQIMPLMRTATGLFIPEYNKPLARTPELHKSRS
jgi:hypothetical protein